MSHAIVAGNLRLDLPHEMHEEYIQVLATGRDVHIERIVSQGHSTPTGTWYDQDRHEFVLLVQGAAGLRIEGEGADRELKPGDHILIPAHCRHRVTWTAPGCETIWLAVHFA